MIFIWIFAAFFALIWGPVFVNWSRDCYNAWDFGIYSEALSRISWSDPNPILNLRRMRIFEEHFDPILVLAAPLANIVDPSLATLLVEGGFFLLAGWLIVRATRRGTFTLNLGFILLTILLFSSATRTAIFFPAHPGAWIAPSILGMALAARSKRWGWLLFSAFTLFLFKEESY